MRALRKNLLDRRLRRRVEVALAASPCLEGAQIAVAVSAGVVTLRGTAPTLAGKASAGELVARLPGVLAVANALVVPFQDAVAAACAETARAAVAALNWNLLIPKNAVTVLVADGWVTLRGTVDWHYQRHLAGREVRGVKGVRGITNEILVRPRGVSENLVVAVRYPAKEYIH